MSDAIPAQRPQSPTRRSSKQRRRFGALTEMIIIVVGALLLSFLIKTFLVQPFSIPSDSMNNTLLTGDRVLVSKMVPQVFDVHRGDVVVFRDSQGWLKNEPKAPEPTGARKVLRQALTGVGILPQDAGEHLIKRTIGLGGDEVKCCDAQGLVTVNGVALHESYLKPGSIPSEIEFDVIVPPDHLWVMGDNRQNSADSRYHLGDPGGGFVPVKDVTGTAFVKIWPVSRWAAMRNPGATFADVPAGTGAPVAGS